jgi:hypothetical protein
VKSPFFFSVGKVSTVDLLVMSWFLLQPINQFVPDRVHIKRFRVSDNKHKKLRSCQCYVDPAVVFEEANLVMVVCTDTIENNDVAFLSLVIVDRTDAHISIVPPQLKSYLTVQFLEQTAMTSVRSNHAYFLAQ